MDLTVLITLVSGHGVDLYEKEKLKSKKYSLLQNFQSRLSGTGHKRNGKRKVLPT